MLRYFMNYHSWSCVQGSLYVTISSPHQLAAESAGVKTLKVCSHQPVVTLQRDFNIDAVFMM